MLIMIDKSHSNIFYILYTYYYHTLRNQEIVQCKSNNNFINYQVALIKNILLTLEIKYD